jgi:predicted dehydrogenase
LVEKPIATTVDDAQRLIDAARAHDQVLMVGHVERFNPAVVELESLMDEPVAIEISRIGPFSPRVLADVVLDLVIHDIDLARALAGSRWSSTTRSPGWCARVSRTSPARCCCSRTAWRRTSPRAGSARTRSAGSR